MLAYVGQPIPHGIFHATVVKDLCNFARFVGRRKRRELSPGSIPGQGRKNLLQPARTTLLGSTLRPPQSPTLAAEAASEAARKPDWLSRPAVLLQSTGEQWTAIVHARPLAESDRATCAIPSNWSFNKKSLLPGLD